ncbi:MAG: endonuclease/exonuclease/phosphatase family protein [Candidatus Nanopelagicales bacterium]|nr:endonuclease/exonuclease/phosphatase family protein [Candidatus Nanopelagicales bacterium]MDZ4248743.1 endonuclease/exonuclease/phosphatase family protein [Candidatus Nanopelagicales bacterium]
MERRGPLGLMTYNLYLGADVSVITDAAEGRWGQRLLDAAAVVYQQAAGTDFPSRAAAIARTILRERPAAIALNEVASWASQDGAGPLEGDYLDILLDELSREGMEYGVACQTRGADLRIPFARGGPTAPGVEMMGFRNRDVILVDLNLDGLEFHTPGNGDFQAQRVLRADGHVLDFNRGWASVHLTYAGSELRFIATHLEVASNPLGQSGGSEIQRAQAEEILRIAGSGSPEQPVVLAGDLNTDADGRMSDTYALLTREFFTDTWVAAGKRGGGSTCCQDPDLANTESALRSRIDLILTHGSVETLSAKRVGARKFRSGPAPLWASDHAGYVARVLV